MRFEILGPIRNVEQIASGCGVRIRKRLKRLHGGTNWRKLKGIALIQDEHGDIYEAEIHWFEAHGVGKRNHKIKRALR